MQAPSPLKNGQHMQGTYPGEDPEQAGYLDHNHGALPGLAALNQNAGSAAHQPV